MADKWISDYSNFKWTNSDKNLFIVLNNNTFTLYSIPAQGQNSDLRKQDVELSESCGTLYQRAIFPCDSHHRKIYKNFVVHPTKIGEIVTSCQQKLYLIDVEKGESSDILNLSTDRRQAVKRINLLDWNKRCVDNVALSIDKFRTAKSIHIADINKGTVIQEFGSEGEGVQSMAWSPHHADTLVAGTSKKRLEIFDMRGKSKDSGRRTNDIQEIDGACFSPKYEHILASHSDEYVKIWDSRFLKSASPVHSIKSPTPDIFKIEWSPTHPTRLSYITKGGKHIQIKDFPANTLEKTEGDQTEFTGVHDQEPQHKQKSAPEMFGSTISNFSWHPKVPNRILCCKKTNDDNGIPVYKLYDIALYEPIIAKFSPFDSLVWGCSGTLANCSMESQDISDTMKQRIFDGYGFDPSLNKKIVGQGSLNAFWSFYEGVICHEKSKEDNDLRFKNGVYSLLQSVTHESRQEQMSVRPTPIVYVSSVRSKCQEICRWPHSRPGRDDGCDGIVKKLISAGEQDKAVAMMLFYRGIDAAITLLQNIINDSPLENNEKRILLLHALSGFNEQWIQNIRGLGKSVRNAYQRAMFTFLSTEPGREDAYREILYDRELLLEDRVGFACCFLSDARLLKFVGSQCSEEVAVGNIRAIVLTGLKYQLRELLQSYLDRTSDVQTVCLALTMAKKHEPTMDAICDSDPRDFSAIVMENYLRYFDMRCMWIERALFQNDVKKLLKNKAKIEQHLYVICSCYKSISDRPSLMYNTSAKQSRAVNDRAPSSKETHDKRFCPSKYCKSPMLPRCALCMYHLGTTSRFQPSQAVEKRGSSERRQSAVPEETRAPASNPLKEWFVWCLACGHGGHSLHIRDWFSEHKLCPSPGCKCTCSLLDMSLPLDGVAR